MHLLLLLSMAKVILQPRSLLGRKWFCSNAKQCGLTLEFSLIKDRGIDALINLCLLGPVFTMGSVFVGFVCALLGFVYSEIIEKGYSSGNNLTFAIIAFSFLIGSQICSIMVTPLSTGVDTIFVAAAWDPDVLQRDHPDLYAQMLAVYPPLANAIHA